MTVINAGTLDLNNYNRRDLWDQHDRRYGSDGDRRSHNLRQRDDQRLVDHSGDLRQSRATTANGPRRTFTVASGTVPNNGPDLAVSAILSGAGAGITKAGAGTLTLSSNNTYTGATTVNAGTLLVNGSQPVSAVTVNTGAILGGTDGTVGAVSDSGGTISPGAAMSAGSGILNTGNVMFSSTAAYNVDLNGTTAGSGYDELNAAGTVALGASTA